MNLSEWFRTSAQHLKIVFLKWYLRGNLKWLFSFCVNCSLFKCTPQFPLQKILLLTAERWKLQIALLQDSPRWKLCVEKKELGCTLVAGGFSRWWSTLLHTMDGWMEETRRCFFFYESHNYHCRAHLSWILGGPGQAPRLHWYSDRLSNTSGWSKWTRPGRGFSNICRCPKARPRPSSASSSCNGASGALGAASAHWRCSLVGLADLDLLHLLLPLLARAEKCCPSPSYWWRGPAAARGHAY